MTIGNPATGRCTIRLVFESPPKNRFCSFRRFFSLLEICFSRFAFGNLLLKIHVRRRLLSKNFKDSPLKNHVPKDSSPYSLKPTKRLDKHTPNRTNHWPFETRTSSNSNRLRKARFRGSKVGGSVQEDSCKKIHAKDPCKGIRTKRIHFCCSKLFYICFLI